jgi:lysine 2,3-aminomutase
MFIPTIRSQGLALRPKPRALSQSIAQYRSASTLTDQEPYWQKIKPWKDVPAEEFKSYRWQVSSDCVIEYQGEQLADVHGAARKYRS